MGEKRDNFLNTFPKNFVNMKNDRSRKPIKEDYQNLNPTCLQKNVESDKMKNPKELCYKNFIIIKY